MASNSAYIAPSVSITQEITPQVQPILVRPTSIAIVGETLGYLSYAETVFLDDINAVTLKQSGIDASTLSVVSALDPSATAYVSGTDFVLSSPDSFGNRTLKRNLYTTIPTATDLAVIYVDNHATAIYETALTGSNNDLRFTSSTGDTAITIRYVDPGAPGASLSVSVASKAITVNLATNGGSAITSTANLILAAVNASVPAFALVTASLKSGNDGTGVVTAMAFQSLVADETANTVTTTGSFAGFDPTINVDALGVAITTGGADRLVTSRSNLASSTNPTSITDTNGFTAFHLESFGAYPTTSWDAVVTPTTATIARASVSSIYTKQKVYVTYETAAGFVRNEAIILTATTPMPLAEQAAGVVEDSIIVTNSPNGTASLYLDASGDPVAPTVYAAGAAADYIVTVFGSETAIMVDRNLSSAQGVNTIGLSTDNIAVRVSYQATPTDYYQPTRFFNQSDVEAKYGAALTSSGNINSPASFGAYMAFLNGASDVVVQPLFHTSDATDLTAPRTRTSASTYSADWAPSLVALRDLEDVNVVVPVFAKTISSGTITNATVSTILSAVMTHINFMRVSQGQYVIGIFGEDSTISGLAAQQILQNHARTNLGSNTNAEDAVLVSPGSYAFANPQSGTLVRIGGQYVAAAISGMLASRAIQVPLTRKPVIGISDVLDFRSESDKNLDAAAGLMVIESKGGVVRVRHAITSAVLDVNTRELSVIRAKNFMMESIRQTLDQQIVGQIIAGTSAPFTVSTTIQGVLEALVASGAIVDYAGLAARSLAPVEPTAIEVRFQYKPAYPLNYVNVIFAIDTSTGAVSTTSANQNI